MKTRIRQVFREYISLLGEPRSPEKQLLNQQKWDSLDDSLKVPQQTAGVFTPACGATYGVMEKCDFACTSCYLVDLAQQARPLPFRKVKEQLDALRKALGPKGKVQITSGEVTLLPAKNLGEIVAYAKSIGLDPMVMTNGQRILHNPEYLPTLVESYGLEKIGIHIDSTQKGRRGMKVGASEETVHHIRDQFAELIKRVRKQTGKKLHAAHTVTLTEHIFEELSSIMNWMLANLDSFRMISFHPVARVGRTQDTPTMAMTLDAVWDRICNSIGQPLNRNAMYFGHPACSIVAPWIVVSFKDRRYIIEASRAGKRWDKRFFHKVIVHFGGFATVQSNTVQSIIKLVAMAIRSPSILLEAPFYGLYRLWGMRSWLFVFLGHLFTGRRVQVRPFVLVVHKFMGEDELKTRLGRARLDACVFKLPVNGKMVSMCEMNATPLREEITSKQAIRIPRYSHLRSSLDRVHEVRGSTPFAPHITCPNSLIYDT